MEKNIKISMLLEIYSKLLTEKQADIADLYYNQNLSLSEIAEEIGVTRQAVRKSLIEAEKNLFDYENKLEILDKQIKRKKKIDNILKIINASNNNDNSNNNKNNDNKNNDNKNNDNKNNDNKNNDNKNNDNNNDANSNNYNNSKNNNNNNNNSNNNNAKLNHDIVKLIEELK